MTAYSFQLLKKQFQVIYKNLNNKRAEATQELRKFIKIEVHKVLISISSTHLR